MAARAEREWDDLGWKRWLRDWGSSWEERERFAAADPSMAERREVAEIAVPRTLRRGTRPGI